MDDITLLQECVVKVEIKEEECDYIENGECEMLGKNSDELDAPVTVLLQPKVEMDEAEEQEDSVAVDPLADCVEWDERMPMADNLLLRVKKKETVKMEPEEEADAGISSKQAATKEMEDGSKDASSSSSSSRAGSPNEEHEASTADNEDVPTHTNRQPFAFSHCSETFRSKKTLEEHEREYQEDAPCDMYQRQFTVRNTLRSHIKMRMSGRKTKFPCEICGKQFKNKEEHSKHMLVHTGERPYVCNDCGKSFLRKSNFNAHCRLHTGEQPYSCSICNMRFVYKSTLMTHTSHHLNIKPYECKECGKTFVHNFRYARHVRVHTGESPHKCSVCPKTFSTKTILDRHMFIHSRDRKQMSECEVCGGSFQTTYMSRHIRIHTGERPYKCTFC